MPDLLVIVPSRGRPQNIARLLDSVRKTRRIDTHVMGWPGYEWDRDVSPVWAALDDYCGETGLEWQDMPGRYGLGIIRP